MALRHRGLADYVKYSTNLPRGQAFRLPNPLSLPTLHVIIPGIRATGEWLPVNPNEGLMQCPQPGQPILSVEFATPLPSIAATG